MKHLLIILLFPILLTACFEDNAGEDEIYTRENNCKPGLDPQHAEALAQMDTNEKVLRLIRCQYPLPPLNKWHAVYTADFAEKYNLPPENISEDFSAGVEYMEMEVLPYGNGGVGCFANMLVKKPHDVAFFKLGDDPIPLMYQNRSLLNLIDIEKHKESIKETTTFSVVSRDYNLYDAGYSRTTRAIYAEDVLPGYDYISSNMICYHGPRYPEYFPGGHAFWGSKASVWGKYETPYSSANNPERPRGQDFYDSKIFINIPQELVAEIFKDIPLGGLNNDR